MAATLDDDQEELMEAFTVSNFYLFTTLLIYLVYKYSVHFPSFLVSSDTKKNLLSLVSQFITDVLDSLGVLLRFFVFLARLSLYDFLDDILDSYYIFVCDFDEDEYRTGLAFAAQHAAAFGTDSLDDRFIFFENEVNFMLKPEQIRTNLLLKNWTIRNSAQSGTVKFFKTKRLGINGYH
jgi:hypothetical protein